MPTGLEPQADEPSIPEDVTDETLPRAIKAELRGLPKELAQLVGAHLVMAGNLIDENPELALKHAEAARRRAARMAVVREATAEAAYAAGAWSKALTEYRAVRRMKGADEYAAVMADCERALGRPDEALRLIHEVKELPVFRDDPVQSAELLLVEAGARADLGQVAEASRLLRHGAERLQLPEESLARVCFACADLLWRTGDHQGARSWFERAADHDQEGDLEVAEHLAELEGKAGSEGADE